MLEDLPRKNKKIDDDKKYKSKHFTEKVTKQISKNRWWKNKITESNYPFCQQQRLFHILNLKLHPLKSFYGILNRHRFLKCQNNVNSQTLNQSYKKQIIRKFRNNDILQNHLKIKIQLPP